jgi:hypothetical protein
MTVTLYLERARECAALADDVKGDEQKQLLAIAEAWLTLADGVAKAAQSAVSKGSKLKSV